MIGSAGYYKTLSHNILDSDSDKIDCFARNRIDFLENYFPSVVVDSNYGFGIPVELVYYAVVVDVYVVAVDCLFVKNFVDSIVVVFDDAVEQYVEKNLTIVVTVEVEYVARERVAKDEVEIVVRIVD